MPVLIEVALVVYAVASVVSFVMYGLDKRAAIRARRRVPEATLHVIDLAGGFPGGLVSRWLFRHKTRKLSFRLVTWGIVALHAIGWAGALWMWMG